MTTGKTTSSVQFSHSAMSDSVTLWTAARQASLSISNSQSLLKFMSIESVMSSNHLILCCPLLLLPSIFHSIKVFSKVALTRRTFVGKVVTLLFNMLSRLVITLLPRSKRLLISWLQSPSAVILEPKIIRSVTVSIAYPSFCQEVMGLE